ncbi:hypothetical protein O6H91_22G006000 [Diphasiastrum complanatum]|uniref:Uncharacterized protein n=3 Tax=Diphasiastrum complanatum TaxID=34168 RepID=A0ACC2ACD5_DIPCM|nr:hypothetical protein O6H91_22G006000 [Diphasiastrum complanatum]
MVLEYESNIDIYLRMRPMSSNVAAYEVDEEAVRVQWLMPRQAVLGMANHQREHYNFSFTGIFDVDAKQDAVFENVAQKVILGALDGFNGTIFAYGQTGSGKTYTITGGAEHYVDRGIIPRAISLIFSELGTRSEYTYTMHFSYLEIYNETGYDLLNPDHETKELEDLPKVILLEDDDSKIHLRNLSTHLATNEEEALNLLFLGDTNRMISATPMNMASSRSHCIFTAYVEARKAGEDTVRRSKLHLVDLAGSERASKTGIDGQILKEAKYINLSLHFLEQVIIALHEKIQGKPRSHIPYRNSMMTSVLRDSLGGNCRTVMIATVSVAQDQLEETISTCRFAQRVAMVSNQVMLNEEVDPNFVIKRLKQEIKDLKMELKLLRGEDFDREPLTSTELNILKNQVTTYIQDTSPDAYLNCEASVLHVRAAFQILKDLLNESGAALHQKPAYGCSPTNEISSGSGSTLPLNETIQSLYHQLQQRDNEINILVSFIRKRESVKAKVHAFTQVQPQNGEGPGQIISEGKRSTSECATERTEGDEDSCTSRHLNGNMSMKVNKSGSDLKCPSNFPSDQKQAFELFMKDYPKVDVIEENKSLLKRKYNEAKALGEQVNKARENINELKIRIEKHRLEFAMQNLMDLNNGTTVQSDLEQQLILSVEDKKRVYKEGFNKLRDLKREIEHLHMLLEQSSNQMQADFDQWLCIMSREQPASVIASSDRHIEPCANTGSVAGRIPNSGFCEMRPGIAQNLGCKVITEKQAEIRDSPQANENLKMYLQLSENDSIKELSCSSLHNYLQQFGGSMPTHGMNCNSARKIKHYPGSSKREPLMLTGNASTDADILAFYKAKQDILRLRSWQHSS